MRARIYNRLSKQYYISEVYAVINRAGDWYVVDAPDDPGKLCLVEYLDFSTQPPYEVNVEIIDKNPVNGKWVYRDGSEVESLNENLQHSKKVHYYGGELCLWDNVRALTELLETGLLEKAQVGLATVSTKLAGWNYIESKQDIDRLMQEYSGFHDAVLKELSYVSGDYFDVDGMILSLAGSKQVRVVFNSDWAKEIEIMLLAPRVVHLVPAAENYTSELFEASVLLKDHMVYFYDSDVEEIMDEYDGTYFVSMGMMWRYTA